MAERHLSASSIDVFPGRRTSREVIRSLRDLGPQTSDEHNFQKLAYDAISEIDDVLDDAEDLFDEGIETAQDPITVVEFEPEQSNIILSDEIDKPRKRKSAITNPVNPLFPEAIPEQPSESSQGVDISDLSAGLDRLHQRKELHRCKESLVSLDSALGNSLSIKGAYKEVDPSGETYFVYPAVTVQSEPLPVKEDPAKDIDPFHRFKKLRKSIAVDMPDKDSLVDKVPERGATNLAFSSDGEPDSSRTASMHSSGYDSGNGQHADGARNRKSYQEAMGRNNPVDESPKSGDFVHSFRPGGYDDMDDLNPHCDSDEDSLGLLNHPNDMMEVKSETKEQVQERTKQWDVFRDPLRGDGDGAQELCYSVARQLFKLFTYAFLLIAVLGLAMISKGTLLMVASNLRHSEDFRLECIDYVENNNAFSKCVELPYNHKPTFDRHCLRAEDKTGNLTQLNPPYQRPMCPVMIVQWAWGLLLIICTPYVFTFIRCFLRVCFKHKKPAKGRVLGIVLILETLHAVGMGMFAFRVLPLLDNVIQGLMLMCAMSVVPSILKLLTRPPQTSRKFNVLHIVLDVFSLIAQLSALVIWPLLSQTQNWHNGNSSDLAWSIPASLFLISFKHWENYVDKHTRLGKLGPIVLRLVKDIKKSRTKIYLMVSFWKICVTFLMMIAFLSMEVDTNDLFRFDPNDCANTTISYIQIPSIRLDWVFIWIVNMVAALLCYFCARTAIKIQMQRFSFSVPLTLATPFLLGLLIGGCEAWNDEPCTFVRGAVPGHLFYKCWPRGELGSAARDQQWWLLAVWWLSQLWLTWHIWWPKLERLVKTDQFFVQPLYDGVVLEQSLMYNLIRKQTIRKNARASLSYLAAPDQAPRYEDDFDQDETHTEKLLRLKDETPQIYICATMWHENELEMMQMLKSIGRLDIDQCARRNAQDHLGIIDPDYYEFEAHIFFDDAMEGHGMDEYEYKVNSFVQLLVDTVDTGISAVHESFIKVPPPVKYPTPYGGRLEWTLPGGNKMVAHLKDKMKIRHKKRWSQVMYMYYFLGHRLWADELSFRRKEMRAENTFLLALDGDVDFEPLAMTLLVDLMKRSDKVGAACGRIHPIGAGPLVWYQKFEYALGHWMQKATEHVLGCVLCSPGCFSLFRGSALMDDNVMKKYTTMPTEAAHYIQYDQGEDRWLCTLLLQQGYKVEYCAASDSWTFAPEAFNEFYNQRRRWMPSTMANILDLLLSWRHTIKMNENISMLYIIYQASIFVFSLIGPGTIFLMIVGALNVALNGAIDMWASFFINLVPIAIFIILCYTTKPDTQLWFASILTAIYALIQMLVLVGIIIQISDQGPCSPTAIFFFYVAGTFVLSALLHPQEFFCLFHGFIYFLAIPSMYLLLMVYSLCNLNVVSWGTREVKQTKSEKEDEEAKQIMQEQKKKKESEKSEVLSGILNMIKGQKKEEGTSCTWGSCCRCLCCPKEVPVQEDLKFKAILNKLEIMENNMSDIKEEVDVITNKDERQHKASLASIDRFPAPRPRNLSFNQSVEVIPDSLADIDLPGEFRDELVNPIWIEDGDLGAGPLGKLSQKEILFFKDLIVKYLFPLEKNKAQEERIAMELNDLKNKMSFGFLLANGIFVVVMFTLQMNVAKLAIPWPCGENLQIEPLGFFFLCFFGLILVLQTIGMITHRMSTFLHIVATTTLTWFRGRKDKKDDVHNAIELARNLGALKEDDTASVASTTLSEDDDGEGGRGPKRSKTMRKIQKAKQREGNNSKSMDQQFTRRMEKLAHQLDYDDISAEEIERKVLGRKNSTGMTRRKSVSAIKFLQSRRDRDPRGRGWSTTSVSKPKERPSLNVSKSLDDQRMSSSLGRIEGGRMSIVNEDGESSFYEDVGNFRPGGAPVSPTRPKPPPPPIPAGAKPPPPPKPALKKPLELSEVVIKDEDGKPRRSASQDQSSF